MGERERERGGESVRVCVCVTMRGKSVCVRGERARQTRQEEWISEGQEQPTLFSNQSWTCFISVRGERQRERGLYRDKAMLSVVWLGEEEEGGKMRLL